MQSSSPSPRPKLTLNQLVTASIRDVSASGYGVMECGQYASLKSQPDLKHCQAVVVQQNGSLPLYQWLNTWFNTQMGIGERKSNPLTRTVSTKDLSWSKAIAVPLEKDGQYPVTADVKFPLYSELKNGEQSFCVALRVLGDGKFDEKITAHSDVIVITGSTSLRVMNVPTDVPLSKKEINLRIEEGEKKASYRFASNETILNVMRRHIDDVGTGCRLSFEDMVLTCQGHTLDPLKRLSDYNLTDGARIKITPPGPGWRREERYYREDEKSINITYLASIQVTYVHFVRDRTAKEMNTYANQAFLDCFGSNVMTVQQLLSVPQPSLQRERDAVDQVVSRRAGADFSALLSMITQNKSPTLARMLCESIAKELKIDLSDLALVKVEPPSPACVSNRHNDQGKPVHKLLFRQDFNKRELDEPEKEYAAVARVMAHPKEFQEFLSIMVLQHVVTKDRVTLAKIFCEAIAQRANHTLSSLLLVKTDVQQAIAQGSPAAVAVASTPAIVTASASSSSSSASAHTAARAPANSPAPAAVAASAAAASSSSARSIPIDDFKDFLGMRIMVLVKQDEKLSKHAISVKDNIAQLIRGDMSTFKNTDVPEPLKSILGKNPEAVIAVYIADGKENLDEKKLQALAPRVKLPDLKNIQDPVVRRFVRHLVLAFSPKHFATVSQKFFSRPAAQASVSSAPPSQQRRMG